MPLGYLSLVLHAHLPFVRHPEFPQFLEEDWLYEAIGETYIPLARMMERLLPHGGVELPEALRPGAPRHLASGMRLRAGDRPHPRGERPPVLLPRRPRRDQ